MSFLKPKYSKEQKDAIESGLRKAQKVQPVGLGMRSAIAKVFTIGAKKAAAKAVAKRVANVGRGDLSKHVDRTIRRQEEEIMKAWKNKKK